MAASLDYYLRTLAGTYYLKNNSDEIARIRVSVANLFQKIDNDLGILINRKFVFGSYDRDTILPRRFDSKSDVDIMVVFNHTEYERTPETYRAWLKNFADRNYKSRYGSDVVKSFPTIVIKLGHIQYDLVPAMEEKYFGGSKMYIPGNSGWQITDPNDIKQKLVNANTAYNQIVRPVIRLMKAWNCNCGYPLDSYQLELQVTSMNFYGDNVQSGFSYAVRQLSTSYKDPQTKIDKIDRLRYNVNKVEDALAKDDVISAKEWLHRILPQP